MNLIQINPTAVLTSSVLRFTRCRLFPVLQLTAALTGSATKEFPLLNKEPVNTDKKLFYCKLTKM